MSGKIQELKRKDGPGNPLQLLAALSSHPDYSFSSDPHYFASVVENISSPLHLPDLEKGIGFFDRTISEKGHILVLGDRDVDGVASTAILGNFLIENHREKGGKLDLHVSLDGDDYGLTNRFLDIIDNDRPDLVVLLDMGSAHGVEVDRAVASGARVIVLDHHAVVGDAPAGENIAFINPVLGPEHLDKTATVGLVFKFLLAYAFSHTRDWKTCQWIPVKSEHQGNLFHLGKHLGEFASIEDARKFSGENGLNLSILDSRKDPVFRLDPSYESFLQAEPEVVGRFLLARQIRSRPRLTRFVTDLSDLVAIGLITDMMPLVGETRSMVRLGSGHSTIRHGELRMFRPGLRSLLKALRIHGDRISSRDLGWSVGPTLNAAGRMGKTRLALELLVAREEDEAARLSKELIGLNKERKDRTGHNEKLANDLLEANPGMLEHPLLIFFHPDFEPGVSGIVATRFAEKYERPVIFINPDGEFARGSARSPGGEFNVLALLEKGSDHLIQYGGHKEAAGFSIEPSNIELFTSSMIQIAREILEHVENQESIPAHHLELEPADLTWRLLEEIQKLEPFGPGNPEPFFLLPSVRIHTLSTMGADKSHAKFRIQGAPPYLEAIAWKMGKKLSVEMENTGGEFLIRNLVGTLELSFFAGKRQLRFRVESLFA